LAFYGHLLLPPLAIYDQGGNGQHQTDLQEDNDGDERSVGD
jgi:hypothetical protein